MFASIQSGSSSSPPPPHRFDAATPPPAVLEDIRAVLAEFAPISLDQMENVKLLDRMDTKFLTTEEHLLEILESVRDDYRVLTHCGVQAHLYHTQYFDTPDRLLYMVHHNDHRDRYKVRARAYLDSGVVFLEVKHKTPKRRTIKQRMPIDAIPMILEGEHARFVDAFSPVQPQILEPVIWNMFHRITLVSKTRRERLTVDVGLRYGWAGREGELPGIAVIEVKQPKFSIQSDFVQQLRRRHIWRMGFSKYCAGMSEIYPHLKANRFKPRRLYIARLLRQRGGL